MLSIDISTLPCDEPVSGQVSFHSLRHSNTSLRIQGGRNIEYISEQMGHSTIRITLDVYGRPFDDVDFTKQQVEKLDVSFGSVRNRLENSENCSRNNTDQIHNRLELLTN